MFFRLKSRINADADLIKSKEFDLKRKREAIAKEQAESRVRAKEKEYLNLVSQKGKAESNVKKALEV